MSFPPASPLVLEGLNKYLSIVYHQWINYAIYAFAELRVADNLVKAQPDKGMTAQEILGEERKNWNADLLHRILRACEYGGVVKLVNDDKHFVLTESGKLLVSEDPLHARDYIVGHLGPIVTGGCHQLPNMIRNGGTASGVLLNTGLDFYAYVVQPEQREFLGVFSNTMTTTAALSARKLVENVDFGRFKTLVDIGGNRGTLTAHILRKFPSIQLGTVFDLPPVVNKYQDGSEFDLYQIPKNQWKFVAGNMYDASTLPQADAYTIKFVIHSISREEIIKTFNSIRIANENKDTPTTLFIIEHVILPFETVGSWQTFAIDILMASLLVGARERSVPEYEELLNESGFKLKRVYPIEAPQSVIEAELIRKAK